MIECGPYQSSPIRAKTHNQIFIFVVRLAIILTHTTLTFPRDFADHVSMLSFHHKLSIVSAARPPPASVTAFNPSGSGAVEGHLNISLGVSMVISNEESTYNLHLQTLTNGSEFRCQGPLGNSPRRLCPRELGSHSGDLDMDTDWKQMSREC